MRAEVSASRGLTEQGQKANRKAQGPRQGRPEGQGEEGCRKSAEGTQKMIKMYKNETKIKPKLEYEGHKREGDAESDLERRRKTRRDAQ